MTSSDDLDGVLNHLLKPICPAHSAFNRVPGTFGYYSIFIDEERSMPAPFRTKIELSRNLLLYIGMAAKSSLHNRLLEQDLYGKSNSTFFRGIGAILGYRPPFGSLKNKSNQNNYKFSKDDSSKIREWNEQHLLVSWFVCEPSLVTEMLLIKRSLPLLNSDHNPNRDSDLADRREECRRIARGGW